MTGHQRISALFAVLFLISACGSDDTAPADKHDDPAFSSSVITVTDADITNPDRTPLVAPDVLNPFNDYRDAADNEQAAFSDLAYTFPSIAVDAKYTHILNFLTSPFFPPWRKPIVGNGPVILYSDDMDVLVFSPMDEFFDPVMTFEDGAIQYGLNGELQSVPAGLSQRFLLVEGKGMAATLEYWGAQILADRQREKTDRYADKGLSYLGYWTDNGAAYYYNTEENLNYEDTLLAVRDDWEIENIPITYLQLDSWWYFKEGGHGLLPGSGLVRWEPQPEMFPDGLVSFQQALGVPLVVHNRWFAKENDYLDDYDFIEGPKTLIPADNAIYDHFMEDALSWGVITYEQDWLVNQYWRMPYFREQMGRTTDWFSGMATSVLNHDLTMQICMPSTSNLMAAVDLPAVTTTRTSTDYAPSVSKETYYPQFHTNNMLAWALGILPFKDNFHSSEEFAADEALVSALSAGMVGLGDALGAFRRDIVMRTCRPDGLLLKPDRPALPIDAMFLPHQRPYTTYTYSQRENLGRWGYVAAYHLAKNHPDRDDDDWLHAVLMYEGLDVGDMFVYPDVVTDWKVDLKRDFGIEGKVAAYNWKTGEATVAEGGFAMTPDQSNYGYAFYVLAPVFGNGLALIGDPSRYVTMADKRFTAVVSDATGIDITLAGLPGETLDIRAFDADAAAMLPPFSITIGDDGSAQVRIER